MTNIKIVGVGDWKTVALQQNLSQALSAYPLKAKVKEVKEFNQIFSSGVHETPALIIDNEIAAEGQVPTATEIEKMLRNRAMLKSKLVRLKKILVPVDFSAASRAAVSFAWEIACAFEANIEVLYAYQGILDGGQPAVSGFFDKYLDSMKMELKGFVEAVTSEIPAPPSASVWQTKGEGGKKPRITKVLYAGFPEAAILEKSTSSDLVVMGTSAKDDLPTWVFGSVSATSAKNAHCPVLVVPENAKFSGFRNVLYASNFDSLSPLKVKETVAFSGKFGGQVHFVHVGQASEPGIKLEKNLFEIHYRYADPEKPFLFQTINGENISEKLNEYADKNGIDLVVFVTHHRKFWEGLWHKSTTKNMVFHATRPILVLHSDDDKI